MPKARPLEPPPGGVPAAVTAWFASQDACGLLACRDVRSHLASFTPHAWPEATRLTLLYGVAALRAAHGQRALSLPELAEAVGARARGAKGVQNAT